MENKTIVKIGFEIFAFTSVGAATAFYRAAQLGERVDERYMNKGFLCVHNDYKKLIMEEADVLTVQEYEFLKEAEDNAAKEEAKKKAEKELQQAVEEIKAIHALDAAVEDALRAPESVS